MPEMTFVVRWPDGTTQNCYSPSLVMHDHLRAGEQYTVGDFRERSTTALREAAERVRAKYGFACTSAAATIDEITEAAARFDSRENVHIVDMYPPLPAPSTLETSS
ncbi:MULTISPECIES: MSMEG_0570 family nitrogen starvation response protein [Gordonia]|uniref:MSMEG_0570 family nitrogen starvation response protein n=1 Tax=Gordonia TaxID=2053 RepID=UPI0020430557|nr:MULTISPECIES: MSMEG_0570 family nitrogen starvation response protein [Gordonia]MCM3895858.1 MSMEG_0570 family nitrogen starvation response protein [Gordonia sputi]